MGASGLKNWCLATLSCLAPVAITVQRGLPVLEKDNEALKIQWEAGRRLTSQRGKGIIYNHKFSKVNVLRKELQAPSQ